MVNFKSGFSPVFVLLVLAIVVLVGTPALKSTVTIKSSDNPAVKGVLIAKGGDDGGSKSGGDSGGGSHDSGGGGSSGGSSGNSSGGGLSNGGGDRSGRVEVKEVKVEKKEVKKPEKLEIKVGLETEKEIENEIEKPEVEKLEIKLASISGLEVELEGSKSGRKNATSSALKVKNLKFETKNGKIEFESHGTLASTNFPLAFDKATDQLFVDTPAGRRQIRVLPDQVADIAKIAGIQTQIEKIELIQDQAGFVFKLSGKKTGNLFGLIPVSAEVETKIDPTSGQVLSTAEPRWLELLSGLIQ